MFENINEIIKVIRGGLAEYDQNADKFVFLHCSEEVIELFGRKNFAL